MDTTILCAIITAVIAGLFSLLRVLLKHHLFGRGSHVPGNAHAQLAPVLPVPPALLNDKNKLIFPSAQPKSTAVATGISLFLPGMGEVYLGQTRKGLTIFFCAFMFIAVWPFIGIYSCFHAHKIGVKLNSGLPIERWE